MAYTISEIRDNFKVFVSDYLEEVADMDLLSGAYRNEFSSIPVAKDASYSSTRTQLLDVIYNHVSYDQPGTLGGFVWLNSTKTHGIENQIIFDFWNSYGA